MRPAVVGVGGRRRELVCVELGGDRLRRDRLCVGSSSGVVEFKKLLYVFSSLRF